MSSTNAPFGLRPSFHPTGLDRAVALSNGIASGYNTGILKGQPVALNTSGNIITATAGSAFQGAFAGQEYTAQVVVLLATSGLQTLHTKLVRK